MPDSTGKSNPADPQFLVRALQYLEDECTAEQLRAFQLELNGDAVKRRAFVELSLSRAGLIEELRNRAQLSRQVRQVRPLERSLDESEPAGGMGETMIMPALILPDQPATSQPNPQSIPPNPSASSVSANTKYLRAAIVLILLGAAVLCWSIYHQFSSGQKPVALNEPVKTQPTPTPESTQTEPGKITHDPSARIGIALNAQADTDLTPGTVLAPGSHTLTEGLLRLDLSTGATLVLQSPAQFEVLSESRVTLTRGKLTAIVPHTHAELTIETPDLKAVDLGTEFAVDVSPFEQTHLEVFKGRVRAETAADASGVFASKVVAAAQSIRVKSGSTAIEKDTPTPLLYVRGEELSDRMQQGGDSGLQRWQAFSNLVRLDPDLIAYYPFDNQSSAPAQLTNRALVTTGQHNGTLGVTGVNGSAPVWSQGRWANKAALKFGDVTDKSVVVIPADPTLTPTQAITIAVWLRRSELVKPVHLIEEADNSANCFNLTVTGTAGKRASQLLPRAIYFNYGAVAEVGSTTVLPADDQWFFLVVTRGLDGEVRMFVNGQPVARTMLNNIPDVRRAGDLWIGRSNPAAVATDQRDVFHGWLDEIALFHRELSAEEIQRFYEAGKP